MMTMALCVGNIDQTDNGERIWLCLLVDSKRFMQASLNYEILISSSPTFIARRLDSLTDFITHLSQMSGTRRHHGRNRLSSHFPPPQSSRYPAFVVFPLFLLLPPLLSYLLCIFPTTAASLSSSYSTLSRRLLFKPACIQLFLRDLRCGRHRREPALRVTDKPEIPSLFCFSSPSSSSTIYLPTPPPSSLFPAASPAQLPAPSLTLFTASSMACAASGRSRS
eukprot:761782-Hanusia_phi.AAC.4